jgi:predicted nuclease of predicted toxin-antitoxin system
VRLILDEQFSHRIAEQLRSRGCDVIAVTERSDLREMNDEDLLRWAHRDGRALVTENVQDFLPIHGRFLSQGEEHSGLVLTSNRKFPRTAAGFGPLVAALGRLLVERAGAMSLGSDIAWL